MSRYIVDPALIPPDVDLREDISQDSLIDVLGGATNRIMFGTETPTEGTENATPFLAVVVAGAGVGMLHDGRASVFALGTSNMTNSPLASACLGKLADKLEQIASALRADASHPGGAHQ